MLTKFTSVSLSSNTVNVQQTVIISVKLEVYNNSCDNIAQYSADTVAQHTAQQIADIGLIDKIS